MSWRDYSVIFFLEERIVGLSISIELMKLVINNSTKKCRSISPIK